MKDFLTITCHSAYNYGAVLQTYALYTYLTNKGLKGKIIDYRPSYFNKGKKDNIIKSLIRPIVRIPDFYKGNKVFGEFLNENIKMTQRIETFEELKSLPISKVYLTGSDQVWNCSYGEVGNDDAFFLKFVDGNKYKKVSYAASIAMDEIDEYNQQRFKKNLKDFYKISVREKTAIGLLKNIGINDVYQTLDPVFLLKEEDWLSMVKKSKYYDYLQKEKYILVYGFLQQKNVYTYSADLAKKNNYKVFNVNTLIEDYLLKTDKYFWNVKPEDFLALIYFSQDVVTNSFHGLAFSVIFKKMFHLFGKKGNSSSRMFDFVKMLDLENRIVNKNVILDQTICYDLVHEKLNKKIEESYNYLYSIFWKD